MLKIGKIQKIIGIIRHNTDLSIQVQMLGVFPNHEEVLHGVGLQGDEQRLIVKGTNLACDDTILKIIGYPHEQFF